MHYAVFGGTGHTGRHLVEQALEDGHEVTALARDPSKLPAHPHLHIVTGDVRDMKRVDHTVSGADAVLSALGQRRWGTTVCTDGMRNILAAMNAHGVRRLLAISGYGVGDSRHRDFYAVSMWIALRSIMRDKTQMEELIRASDTEWTLVRPAVIIEGPHTGRYRAGPDLRLGYASKISYADVADFLLSHLTQEDLIGQAVAIAAPRT
jgi:putative NADH-flavin reductase